jgi:hypothetical protein
MPDPPQKRPPTMTSVVYWDGTGATWDSLSNSPYDIIILSFAVFPEVALLDPVVHSGIVKAADLFKMGLPAFVTTAGIRALHSKGKRVLVSFGGGDKKISSTVYSLAPRIFTALYRLNQHEKDTCTKFAEAVALFVNENKLDGVDIDNEETHISSFDLYQTPLGGTELLALQGGVQFMAKLVNAIRAALDSATNEHLLLTMAIQPTAFIPLLVHPNGKPDNMPRIGMDDRGRCSSRHANSSCFPIQTSENGCTDVACPCEFISSMSSHVFTCLFRAHRSEFHVYDTRFTGSAQEYRLRVFNAVSGG